MIPHLGSISSLHKCHKKAVLIVVLWKISVGKDSNLYARKLVGTVRKIMSKSYEWRFFRDLFYFSDECIQVLILSWETGFKSNWEIVGCFMSLSTIVMFWKIFPGLSVLEYAGSNAG